MLLILTSLFGDINVTDSCLNFGLRTRLQFNIHIFDPFKMTWCTWASSKRNFKQLQPSGEELLHNEAHSTSRVTLLIFQ